jgi:hypothetical protein
VNAVNDVGLPTAFSRREPTLKQWQWEGSAHLGLVGTGPTRIADELRFAPLDWLELRTAFLPYPSSLMARVRIGSMSAPLGALVVDGGVAHADLGFNIQGLTTESRVGLRAHLEGGLTWDVATSDRTRLVLQARARYRASQLSDDDEAIVAFAGALDVDLLRALALSVGAGFAADVAGKVRENSVGFVETGRPGMSWLLQSIDGQQQSFTVPLALVYAPTESFDVDVFATPELSPDLGVVVGAGVRVRL